MNKRRYFYLMLSLLMAVFPLTAHTKTVKQPTYDEPGKKEKLFLCKSCGYSLSKYEGIPRLGPSKSSAAWSGGSSASSWGGGSSGSSSWGGGSSGGGGAGVSW